MSRKILMMTIMVAMTFASACENKGSVQIIPLPVEYKTYNSSYELVQEMKITHNLDAANLENIIAPFNDYLSVKYGFQQLVKETGDKATNGSLVLLLDKDNKRIPNEGYNLKVTAKSIKLEASSHSGLFYGMQSL
ncbi:MAG: glycoside hydrolase family 20 zincin-like fold domain-containing protein, partial [Bacteroidales bacterium]